MQVLMVQRIRRGTYVHDCRGVRVEGGIGACYTTLKEGGIEFRPTHLAIALALAEPVIALPCAYASS